MMVGERRDDMLVFELWLNRVGLSGQKLRSASEEGIGSLLYGLEVGFKGAILSTLRWVIGKKEVEKGMVE
jgi:hypothetical protein